MCTETFIAVGAVYATPPVHSRVRYLTPLHLALLRYPSIFCSSTLHIGKKMDNLFTKSLCTDNFSAIGAVYTTLPVYCHVRYLLPLHLALLPYSSIFCRGTLHIGTKINHLFTMSLCTETFIAVGIMYATPPVHSRVSTVQ